MIQIRENMHMYLMRHTVTPVCLRPCFATTITRIGDVVVLASAKKEGAP
jgi:hypothetical protein